MFTISYLATLFSMETTADWCKRVFCLFPPIKIDKTQTFPESFSCKQGFTHTQAWATTSSLSHCIGDKYVTWFSVNAVYLLGSPGGTACQITGRVVVNVQTTSNWSTWCCTDQNLWRTPVLFSHCWWRWKTLHHHAHNWASKMASRDMWPPGSKVKVQTVHTHLPLRGAAEDKAYIESRHFCRTLKVSFQDLLIFGCSRKTTVYFMTRQRNVVPSMDHYSDRSLEKNVQ